MQLKNCKTTTEPQTILKNCKTTEKSQTISKIKELKITIDRNYNTRGLPRLRRELTSIRKARRDGEEDFRGCDS